MSNPNNRRGKCIKQLIDPEVLNILPVAKYMDYIAVVEANEFEPSQGRISREERNYGRFVILAQSHLGCICWPGAKNFLAKLTFGDVSHNIALQDEEVGFLLEKRCGILYPIFHHPTVKEALLRVITDVCSRESDKNKAPRWMPESTLFGPHEEINENIKLINRYFNQTRSAAGLESHIKLTDFLAASRFLMSRKMSLDTVYATLGSIDVPAPDISQLLKHPPADLLASMKKPIGGIHAQIT